VPSGEDGGRAAIKTPPRAQAQRVRHVETPLWSSVGRPRHRVARPRLSRAGPPPNVRFAIWLSDRTSHTSVRNDDERHVFRSLAWGPPAKRSHVAVCTTLAIGISGVRSSHLLQPVDPERFVRRSCRR